MMTLSNGVWTRVTLGKFVILVVVEEYNEKLGKKTWKI